jgi:transposase InsO family protein
MESKLAAMLADVGSGMCTVTSVCEALGMSRQSYYKYLRRFLAEGPPGLIERSRRPVNSPNRIGAAMVELVVLTRAQLAREGWDNGATSIYYRLLRDGQQPPPPRSIHRLLVRAGLIVPQPKKRPRSSYRRFEFPATDDCWQLDAYEFRLAEGSVVVIFECKDDRSRYLVSLTAWPAETTAGAWAGVAAAIRDYGKPRLLLSDNSLAFTGRLYNIQVLLEKNLHDLGVKTIHSTPHHPQTCGKNERGHQTGQRWLAARPTPNDLVELQQLLDEYRIKFNNRPHQALGGRTPLEQRAASTRISPHPDAEPLEPPTILTTPTASCRGAIRVSGVVVGLGIEYAGEQLIVFTTGEEVKIYYHQYLIHAFTIDRSRGYQPPIRPRGGPRRRPRAGQPNTATAGSPHLVSSTTATAAGRATAVKMQPPTGGTILTAASPGIGSAVEKPAAPLSAMSCP